MTARVLIVDDVFPNIKLLETRLNAEYYEVLSAMNGPRSKFARAGNAISFCSMS